MKKNTNPYANKKSKKRLRITRKQWIAIISLVGVIAIIAGIMVAGNLSKASITDPHAGHNHGDEGTSTTGGHYEGDGHNHGTPTTSVNAQVKYQVYSNADKTYRVVFRDTKGATLFEADKLVRAPIRETVDADKGIYELGWATGSGPNEFECVYYNEKTGQVSQQFHAPRGTDGVRIAYGSEDQTQVIVQELFRKEGYRKVYNLEDPLSGAEDIIMSGALQKDKKAVVISYKDADNATRHATIKLYE